MPYMITIDADLWEALMKTGIYPVDSSDVTRNNDGTVTFPLRDETVERLKRIDQDLETAIRIVMKKFSN